MRDIERKLRECPNLAEKLKFSENIDLYNFAFFVSGGFSNLSQPDGELKSSVACHSTQNDLAHLTESAKLPMDGFAGSYNSKTAYV